MKRFLVLLALLATGCPGSMGTIRGARSNASAFVKSDALLYVQGQAGLRRMHLDGTHYERLVPPGFHLEDMSADGETLVLGDSDTNLFIQRGGKMHRIHEVDGRCSDAALSPDGKRVAAIRHADFSTPQSTWTDDDTLYVVELATMAVTTIPPSGKTPMPIRVTWDPSDSHVVRIHLQDTTVQAVLLGSGSRTPLVAPATPATPRPQYQRPMVCEASGTKIDLEGWNGDEGIALVESGGARRMLVHVDGRTRGFHDYLPTIEEPFFADECKYVVFGFERNVWVADVATGDVGPLLPGSDAFPAPAATGAAHAPGRRP